MTQKFNPSTRKALAKAIGEILQAKAVYQGMPSASYTCGDYKIDRDGLLTGPDSPELLEALAAAGFASETPENHPAPEEALEAPQAAPAAPVALEADPAETEATSANVGALEAEAPEVEIPAEPEGDCVCIEMPLDGFDPPALARLVAMVTAKEVLIKKALNIDSLPIQVLEDRIAFPWFEGTVDGAHIDAYATFIAALCKTAREKKRVTAKAPADGFENESFAMRVWLIGLGLIGPEFKLTRALLGKNLGGNSTYRDGGGIFTAHSYTFPDGDPKAEPQCETTGFHSLAKARAFCDNLDQSECFAGAHVEDQAGNWVYEIPAD